MPQYTGQNFLQYGRRAIDHVASLSQGEPLDPSLRITIHFHPDRLYLGRPILESIAADGLYRSQFETGTSNGGLTARPGGDRWKWESRIFGGAYDHAPPEARPKYGALNHRRRAVGGSCRFGSAHFRLKRETLSRATFCFPDSVDEPRDFGVADRFALAPLAEHAQRDFLDDYIEAQVHGDLNIVDDVEALVLDPCFRNTPVEDHASRLNCPIEWHTGFRLHVETLRRHPNYRGPEFVELGCSLARNNWLTPDVIGDAARTGKFDEQSLKRVWHYIARFGR